MKKVPGVYQIRNKINGKIYIGSSVDVQGRCSVHRMRLRKQVHGNSHLQAAWNKYGEENFEFELLEIVSHREDAVKREQVYLDMLHPEYNVALRAEATNLGRKFSDEIKENMRKCKLGVYDGDKNPFYGKKHSSKTKKILSESAKRRRWPKEHKEHLAKVLMGEKSHYAKLSWGAVIEIRRLYEEEGWTERMLIGKYNMSQSAINKIVRYKTWRE